MDVGGTSGTHLGEDATRMFFLITAARFMVSGKNIVGHWRIEKTGRAKYYSYE